MCTWACWNTQEQQFRDNHRTSLPEMFCGLKTPASKGIYTVSWQVDDAFGILLVVLMHVLDGAFKRVIHITVVYPSASCSWGLVSDLGDEKHGSSSASTAGRIKIFLNLRIPTILFPLLHVYY